MPASIYSWLYDWRHLVEEPTPIEEVEGTVELGSIPAFSFLFMLAISTVIATLGLMASSAAVVIGAMIIAPLMSPILATSFGLITRRWSLTLRSLFTVLTATLLTIGVAFRNTFQSMRLHLDSVHLKGESHDVNFQAICCIGRCRVGGDDNGVSS